MVGAAVELVACRLRRKPGIAAHRAGDGVLGLVDVEIDDLADFIGLSATNSATTQAITIDRAGRMLLPIGVRRQLNLSPGSRLMLDVVAQRIELTPPRQKPMPACWWCLASARCCGPPAKRSTPLQPRALNAKHRRGWAAAGSAGGPVS